jgi:alpha-L-rhamnosidase
MRHSQALAVFLIFLAGVGQATAAVAVNSPRCNELANPIGVDSAAPRFSWMLASDTAAARGIHQTNYQILVASTAEILAQDKGDDWDSGKVLSEESINLNYAGSPLASWKEYFWKVRVWDQDGNPSAWSAPAQWTMGLLSAQDWHAKWIGRDEPMPTADVDLPARWLRKEFTAAKPIRRAVVAFSGLGSSELYINGAKVGDAVLSPALSDYDQRVYYVTYDVTALIKNGANALGAVLGNGRYYPLRVTGRTFHLFGYPKLLLQLRLEYADGTTDEIASDETWKYSEAGPIRANNEYDGENYDARQEMPGWATAGFDDHTWAAASLASAPLGKLCAQPDAPIRVTGTVKPVSMKEVSPGVFIYDMGQNIVGWCRINATGPAGATITLRHAERLHADGTLSMENLRTAKVTDHYTLKGGGAEIWEPRFTYHGFRYVEMTGYPGRPTLDSIEGRVVNDDLESAGDFATSNATLNQIYSNILWGVRGNYRSIPTDCPQRDERQGWLGDRAVESLGETFLFDNHLLYAKWVQDIVDAQMDNGSVPAVAPNYWKIYNDDVTWPSALLIIPNTLRDQFGDTATIARSYPAMAKWIDHMSGCITGNIMPNDKYGDWCMPPEDPKIIHSTDPARLTAGPLLGTTYFYYDLGLMENYAKALERPDDAKRFADLATRLKDGLNEQYFKKDLAQYDNGTQTSSVLPLAFGMVPADQRQRVFDQLVKDIAATHNHIGTGLIGCSWLNRVLNDNGRPDLAYTLATNHDFPSWGYMIDQGATTVWELWNGDTADVKMNSGNHVMLVGDLAIWFFQDLAGIRSDPEHPGFKNILMQPTPTADLTFVKASHRSPYGLIESEWHKDGATFRWHITVPPNSTATIFVPTNSPDTVQEGGKNAADSAGIKFLRAEPGRAVYQLESGIYEFQANNG